MSYLLLQDCEVAFEGKKSDCLAFSKKHPNMCFRLLVVNGECEVRGGKIL